jgi:hypothetical protein
VIVDVRGRLVILALLVLIQLLVGVDEWGVVVLVLVVMRPVLELAERAPGVMVGHVIVIVGVEHRRMGVLVLSVADDTLHRCRLLQGTPPELCFGTSICAKCRGETRRSCSQPDARSMSVAPAAIRLALRPRCTGVWVGDENDSGTALLSSVRR